MQLRVCIGVKFSDVTKLVGQDFDSSGYARRLEGSLSEFLKLLIGIDFMERKNISIRYLMEGSVGHPDNNGTGRFTGCLGAMQEDRADVLCQYRPFPLDAENITQGPAITTYNSAIVSAFEPNEIYSTPDLLEYANHFSFPFLILLLTSVLFLIISTRLTEVVKGLRSEILRNRNRKRRPALTTMQSAWHIISNIMTATTNDSRDFRKHSQRLVLLSLALLVTAYRLHSSFVMRTEQVVRVPSVRMRAMDQLIRSPETHMVWISEFEYELFRKSKIQDIQLIMKRSLRFGKKNILLNKLGTKNNDIKLMEGIKNRSHVVLVESSVALIFKQLMCRSATNFKWNFGRHRMIHTRLRNSPKPLAGVLIRSGLQKDSPQLFRLLRRSIQWNHETMMAGGLQRIRKHRSNEAIKAHRTRTKEAKLMQCFRNNIGEYKSKNRLFVPTLHSLKNLITICLYSLAVALICLAFESFWSKCGTCRRPKIRKHRLFRT